jgi:hypothetical protein
MPDDEKKDKNECQCMDYSFFLHLTPLLSSCLFLSLSCVFLSPYIYIHVDRELRPFQTSNVQIGNVNREEEDSGYEALLFDNGIFYVLRESVQHDDTSYHAIVEELNIQHKDDNEEDEGVDYDVVDQCSCEFEFEGDSKGTQYDNY